jgi:hypothetical protein
MVVWFSGWIPMFWEITKPWTIKNVSEVGTLKYDFVQAMFYILFALFVQAIISVPSELFS